MNPSWHKIAESITEINFSAEGLATITVSGKESCIILHKGRLHACAAKCPHAGGNLTEGYIDALGNIVCPVHHYRFNLQNGRNSSGEGYYLKTYAVEEREDGVYVEIQQ